MRKPTSRVTSFSLEELDGEHYIVEGKHKDIARWTQGSLLMWLEETGDLDAKSFQSTWSKRAMEGKSFLNVFLL